MGKSGSARCRPLAAGALIKRLGTEFAPQAREKGLELRLMPAELSVTTDPALLSRILRNLLSNAIRYTLKGRVLFGARRRGSHLRFEVWDTGVGIADDQIEDIFREFYQVSNPERDRTQGLGLGLAVVARLSTLLGRLRPARGTGRCPRRKNHYRGRGRDVGNRYDTDGDLG